VTDLRMNNAGRSIAVPPRALTATDILSSRGRTPLRVLRSSRSTVPALTSPAFRLTDQISRPTVEDDAANASSEESDEGVTIQADSTEVLKSTRSSPSVKKEKK